MLVCTRYYSQYLLSAIHIRRKGVNQPFPVSHHVFSVPRPMFLTLFAGPG